MECHVRVLNVAYVENTFARNNNTSSKLRSILYCVVYNIYIYIIIFILHRDVFYGCFFPS